jgi:aminoglycoside phosphotransferase
MKTPMYHIKNQEWSIWIPRGTKTKLAEKFGLTKERIRQIINSGTRNFELYEAIRNEALEYKKYRLEQQEFVSNIIEKLKQLQS